MHIHWLDERLWKTCQVILSELCRRLMRSDQPYPVLSPCPLHLLISTWLKLRSITALETPNTFCVIKFSSGGYLCHSPKCFYTLLKLWFWLCLYCRFLCSFLSVFFVKWGKMKKYSYSDIIWVSTDFLFVHLFVFVLFFQLGCTKQTAWVIQDSRGWIHDM